MKTAYKNVCGVLPAVPTPFKGGRVDLVSFSKHLSFLKDSGVHGVVICGTTGEAPNVNTEEFQSLYNAAREILGSEFPIVCGVGTNSTAATIEKAKMAESWRADALLITTPYYNKPPQEGLYQHFKTIAEAAALPIILYNIPGRAACNLLPDTVRRLAAIENIVAIKEASGVEQPAEIIELCGDTINLLSGEDHLFYSIMALGGKGVISVIANVVPRQMVELYNASEAGDIKKARAMSLKLQPLCKAMFCETNPIPVKEALKQLGYYESAEVRLPLCPISGAGRVQVERSLHSLGIEAAK